MKFDKLSQLFLVSSIGLLVASMLAACGITTIDYVFVASSTSSAAGSEGQIQTFAVDSESGALRAGAPAVDSGGVDPVALATTSDYANLYVANKTSGIVTHFAIAGNGVLTLQIDKITGLIAPVALAVNSAGTYLYVVSQSTSPTTSVTLTEYALSSGTIGAQVTSAQLAVSGDALVPVGITVLVNTSTVTGNGVYVAVDDTIAGRGYVFGFTVGTNGALATTGSPSQAGVKPSGIASDPTDRFVYVTDYTNNALIGYLIGDGSALSPMNYGTSTTGNQPSAVAVDPRGKYIYVTNETNSTVSAYAITLANGEPTAVVSSSGSSSATDASPVALTIDPALGRFIYTANNFGNSISGFTLNPDSGAISPTQATPYLVGFAPSAVMAVPHGNHATETVVP